MSVPVYDIGLGGWNGTSIDYSIPTSDSCYVCRSFSEIDDFARLVSLSNIEKLSVRPPGLVPLGIKSSDKRVDGQELLRSMIEMEIQVNGSVANNNANIPNVGNSGKGMFENLAGEKMYKSYKTAKINRRVIAEIKDGAKIPNEPLDVAYYKANYSKLRVNWLNETFAWRRRNKKCDEAIEGFAKQLLSAFETARDAPPHTESDNILKARLIFAWLATSFSYDDKLAGRKDWEWPLIQNFVTGKAICAGFAALFVLMFNATVKAGDLQACSLTGYCRVLGGNPPPKKEGTGHAWAAFPLKPKDAGYQLVDVTWAINDFANGATNVKNVQWWAMRNDSFNWSHIYNAQYHQLWNQTIPPVVLTQGDPFSNRWNRAQPVFVSQQDDFLHFIDRDSLNQKDLMIEEKNAKNLVTFKSPCLHLKSLNPPRFYLVAAIKANDPQFVTPRTEFESREGGGWSAAFLVKVLTNRAYVAICVEKQKELLPVVIWLRPGEIIPEKYKDK